jgi:U3 small nucleolar RNA-associated protein 21
MTVPVLVHPYVSMQIVVGSEGGQMALVNFMTGSVIYTFQGYGSAVHGLTPSPALDVMGVALADGRAALHDLR